MTSAIPLLVPDMPTADELLPWLRRIDDNRWYTNYGPLNDEFERQLHAWVGGGDGVRLTTVANCTLGLELALAGLELARDARVLVPAITFVASGTAVQRSGLVPLLCDVDPDSWLLTPAIARRALERERFDAVMPVATFGSPQDGAAWDAFAEETGIPVVIDAAGAFGNQHVGRLSSVVFSLHATKSLGAGEGGIVASCDAGLVARVRRATNFGIDLASPYGDALPGGTNAKLSEYHAAVGLAALPRWQRNLARRNALWDDYRVRLSDALGNVVGFQRTEGERVHTLMVARLSGCRSIEGVVEHLRTRGVGARRWYCPPLSHHSAFRDCPTVAPLEHAERLGRELVGLPFHLGLKTAQLEQVVACVGDAVRADG